MPSSGSGHSILTVTQLFGGLQVPPACSASSLFLLSYPRVPPAFESDLPHLSHIHLYSWLWKDASQELSSLPDCFSSAMLEEVTRSYLVAAIFPFLKPPITLWGSGQTAKQASPLLAFKTTFLPPWWSTAIFFFFFLLETRSHYVLWLA